MSDLVGNPEDRFSRVAAHLRLHTYFNAFGIVCVAELYEPRHTKPRILSANTHMKNVE